MDENVSDVDRAKKSGSGEPNDKAKRLKTEDSSMERTEESSSSSNNTEQESASTSSDSGFFRRRISRTRGYRIRLQAAAQPADNESGEEDVERADIILEEVEDPLVPRASSPSSSESTVILDSDSDGEPEALAVLKKEKPKHNWFVVPEIATRQMGFGAKYQASELFQRRCYGSLRNVQRLELMYKLEEHEGCVNSLNFHPTGEYLASGSDDLKVCIWDWKIKKCLINYDTKHKGNVFQSKFLHLSGDLHIASCARDGQVRIAQISRQEGLRDCRKLGSHRGPCHKLAILPEQPHVILSAGEDAVVLSHDVRRSKPEKIVTVKNQDKDIALYSIHAHPLKSHEFCVSGRDDTVRIYDQRKGSSPCGELRPFPRKETGVFDSGLHITCAVYNHNGTEILASYNDEDIYLFDANAATGKFLHRYQGHRNGATIKGVNFFGPKSEFVVSGSDCGHVYFWERETESIVQWFMADESGVVNCLEPHPQLPFICTSGLDYDIKVWVPSKETDPVMKDLAETIKSNNKSRLSSSHTSDINENQMLWMLWRHLRSTNRMRRVVFGDAENLVMNVDSNSSSSDSASNIDSCNDSSDDDDDDSPMGCSTS